ncbi:MAG TPA: histidine kinase dimerization/phosphoacceptor domain -containing protein [Flavobacterium sp.]|jgi:two-component sensor histidine kinase/Tfp pilus assembly protein PilF|nr:histidine kinase dimerization/phosphoacceptor domain -containing protein [Flavobacterium sp.]
MPHTLSSMLLKTTTLFLLIFQFCVGTFVAQTPKEEFDKKNKEFFQLVWNDTKQAKTTLKWLEEFAKEKNKPKFYSKYFNAKATLFFANSNYTDAVTNYLKAYDYAKKSKDKWQQGIVLNNLGGCLYQSQEYKKAKEYFDIAYQLFVEIDDKDWQTNVLYNLAIINFDLENYTEAEKQFLLLEKTYLQDNNPSYAGYCNRVIGTIYIYTNRLDEAIKQLELSLKRSIPEDDLDSYSLSLQKMGHALLETGKNQEALSYLHKSLVITKANQFNKWTLINYELMAQTFWKSKIPDSAYFYYEKSLAYKDTVFNETKQAEFATLETQFKTKLKEEKIIQQKTTIDHKNQIIYGLVFFIIIIIVLLLLFIITRLKLLKSRRKLQKSLDEKESLLREIHHRVKNNLQVVSSLLNMHVRKVTDPDSKKILEEGSDRLIAMSLIHNNLYPHANLKNISLDEYLFKLSHQLFDNYKLNYATVKLNTELEKIEVDIDKLIPIGLIVNELISNAMKHAFHEASEAEISITLKYANTNEIELEVADNGQGIASNWHEKETDSIGMKLITIFSEKLKSKLSIENTNGTKIKLIIPTL